MILIYQDVPRAYTEEELRDMLIVEFRNIAQYWANNVDPEKSVKDRCEGVVHSILSTLDGCSYLPGVDLVFTPHASDKQYHIDNGENWIEPETRLSFTLHECFYDSSIK